jgi:predicted Zn-dependent peptidase
MIQKSILENGIRVITEKMPGVHSVSLGFWVENGSRHESASESGISHFIEHMLFKGTSRRNALDIAKEIDSVGGVLNAFTAREYSCYYAKVLAKALPRAIDLLSDIVLGSIFDLDELEKERRVILQEISMLEDAPDDQVHDLFNYFFWEGHPLGLPILGTRESVDNLSREMMQAFMAKRYCGGKIVICAAGDLVHDQIVEQVFRAFQDVPSGTCAPAALFPSPHHARRIHVLEKDLEQVHICLGTRAMPQNHPSRFASYLLNVILGGSMSSRLFQTVREERGLAYSIYSYLNCHSDAGALVIYAGTAVEDAPHVVNLLLRELNRFRTETVSAEELSSAKEQLKGNLLLSLEGTDNRMTRLAKNEIYMGEQSAIPQVLAAFDRVTSRDLQGLAEETICDDYLNLQLLGRVGTEEFPLIDFTLG